MIEINRSEDCCGCTACASICKHNAIKMEPDTLGFLYPKVDNSKCVDCGLCDKVCPLKESFGTSYLDIKQKCYAARLLDQDKLRQSRSGGVFVAFSDYVLSNGGVVYGAGYKDHFVVAHKRATTSQERDEFCGSKYVQSDLRGVYLAVKNDLSNGHVVLFSGTPCQTAGLLSFIGKRLRENLILVDIICHAVPSPSIWKDYLSYMEKKYKSTAVKVEFRDKSIGWSQPHEERFVMQNGKSYNDFMLRHLFYEGLCTRPSCSECHFANLNRPSDITIGDYWGYQKTVPEMNKDDKGLSIVICNTAKGLEIFEKAKNDLNIKEVSIQDAMQHNLHSPSPASPLHSSFVKDYKEKGFLYVAKRYGNWGIRYKIENIKNRIKRKFKL